MDPINKAEELYWMLENQHSNPDKIQVLAQAWNLPLPSGDTYWREDERLVGINDEPEDFFARARFDRGIALWQKKLKGLGIPYWVYKRHADFGGSIILFILPMKKEEVQEVQEVKSEMPSEKVDFQPRVIRNMVRKEVVVAEEIFNFPDPDSDESPW
jgi:hypothetical protein